MIFLAAASAQDITGQWTGTVMDQYKVTYDFKVQGQSLTGKDIHPDGSASDISNGTIDGDTLSFDVPIQGEMTHVTGKVKGDVMTLHLNVQGNSVDLDLKKEQAN